MALSRSFPRPSLLQNDTIRFICHSCRRNAATYRRTRKALKVKPDPSFLPSKTETQDHIIFNPPSSAPNVYHTPLKFLPKDDPRRKFHALNAPSSTSQPLPSGGKNGPGSSSRLPPPVRKPYEKKYHLTQPDIDEVRRLRAEDPRKWTRARLAEKFECSQFFVSLCCSSPEMKAEQQRELAEVKRKWGRRKTEAREDRQTRKALWGRDG